jgi:hypothetical protein
VTNKFENAPPAQFVVVAGIVAALTLMGVPARAESVLQYHFSSDRAGNYVVPGLTLARARSMHLDGAFDGQVDGHVYAQPLQFNAAGRNLLLVATENDTIDALDAGTGRLVWQKSLGHPVTSAMLPCGNIDPLGITGTPAIDQSLQAMYLDAMVTTGGGPQHLIFGLSLKDGKVLTGFPVNVANALASRGLRFVSREQNQRGALLISHHMVYVPFGGHYGDCGNYHGWVVGVGLDDPQRVLAWSTSAAGGGIWAPGGVVSDGSSLFIATGNTFEASQWGGGEAVIRLGFNLKPPESTHDYFAPSNWRMLDRRDADLGSTAPMLLELNRSESSDHAIIALGKDGEAYLLDRNNLGGIGKQLTSLEVSSDEIKTAPAVYPAPDGGAFVAFPAKFIDCPAGESEGTIGALKLTATPKPSISIAWCASINGGGTPIVTTTDGRSNPIVWMVGAKGDDRLHAFRGNDGQAILTEPQVSLQGLRHFAPIVATTEHLFVPGDGRIYAFAP